MSLQIAPDFDSDQWHALQLEEPDSADWRTAVSVLKSRILVRYLQPVDILINEEADKEGWDRRFGFTVLAIDCLLVETLGAFIEGLTTTDGVSKKTFCSFLTTRPEFANEFPKPVAEQFYRDFRCGILHQAETSNQSKVWSVGPIIWDKNGSLVVNRNAFHQTLTQAFLNYLEELSDPCAIQLRQNFRKKMDFIAR